MNAIYKISTKVYKKEQPYRRTIITIHTLGVSRADYINNIRTIESYKKGYFHSTASIHNFLNGFFNGRQKSARSGRSGVGFPLIFFTGFFWAGGGLGAAGTPAAPVKQTVH